MNTINSLPCPLITTGVNREHNTASRPIRDTAAPGVGKWLPASGHLPRSKPFLATVAGALLIVSALADTQNDPPNTPRKPLPSAAAEDLLDPPEPPPTRKFRGPKAATMQEDAFSQFDRRIYASPPGPAQRTQNLVIRSSETASRMTAEMEEDLTVMARILDKAVDQTQENEERKAMGIVLQTFPVGSTRNLYLEGYGAVFILSVKVPLQPPPIRESKPTDPDAKNSEWEQTKEELYGMRARGARRVNREPAEPYDPAKVETLQSSILEALRNAKNMRHLQREEFVTVVVSNPADPAQQHMHQVLGKLESLGKFERNEFGGGAGSGGGFSLHLNESSAGTAGDGVLTIRVKKSEIEEFANGKLDLEGLRKKARILTYSRGGGPNVK